MLKTSSAIHAMVMLDKPALIFIWVANKFWTVCTYSTVYLYVRSTILGRQRPICCTTSWSNLIGQIHHVNASLPNRATNPRGTMARCFQQSRHFRTSCVNFHSFITTPIFYVNAGNCRFTSSQHTINTIIMQTHTLVISTLLCWLMLPIAGRWSRGWSHLCSPQGQMSMDSKFRRQQLI